MAEPSRHSPPTPKTKPRVDMRALSLTQLQRLAQQGSRRAQAELQARLDASPPVDRSASGAAAPTAVHPMSSARSSVSATAARPVSSARPSVSATAVRATRVVPPAMPLPAALQDAQARVGQMVVAPSPIAPPPSDDSIEQRLRPYELLARQDTAQTRYAALPRLIGLVVIAWGAVMLFGGLILLTKRGGVYYYPVLGAATIAVGWQLWRHSYWAVYTQPLVLALALGWGWHAARGGGEAFIQSAPFLLPAMWMFFGSVRERLA